MALSDIVNNASGNNTEVKQILDYLNSIDASLKSWSKNGTPSQANAKSTGSSRGVFSERYNNSTIRGASKFGNDARKGFIDSFEDELLKGFFGSGFKDDVKKVFQSFADQLGTDLKGIPDEFGKQLGQSVMKAFNQSDMGKAINAKIDNAKQNVLNYVQNRGTQLINRVTNSTGEEGAQSINSVMNRVSTPERGVGGFLTGGARGFGAGLRGAASIAGAGVRGIGSIFSAPGSIRDIVNGTNPLTQPMAGAVAGAGTTEEEQKQELERASTASASSATTDPITSIATDVHAILEHMQGYSSMSEEEASKYMSERNSLTNAGNRSATDMASELNNAEELDIGKLMDSESVLSEASEGPIEAVAENADVLGDAMGTLTGSTEGLVGDFMSLAGGAGVATGALIAFKIISGVVTKALADFKEGLSKLWNAAKNAANRDQKSREKNLEYEKQRIQADYETLVRYPFELLQKAASDLYASWNNNLEVITETQGYTKSGVQDLMASFAQRIRDEGLSSYISGADLVNNLSNVLKAGMSGAIAEEFAYQATVLNHAVPTQDFFSYASTYASVAANAVRDGKSQQEAIEKANESLKSFASSLLYTSRELTGGFSTGLQSAGSIYEEASKIALAANSDNLNAISSALLAIQGYVGAVAPDIANTLTNTIYTLATGGNSSSSVALRSLAGVNASNTEFLRAFASNPKEILATMFENLSAMFTESSDAYMEKAEGYAELFGLSSEAFQRIDFTALANAIRDMNTSDKSLSENMGLLLEGQTTTTAEQLKAQQINQYMIEEGLAYVIDNEAAQMIQEHMWAEQMNRELMEANYSVDLIGDAKEGLLKIVNAVSNIVNLLNPFAWFKKIGNVFATIDEGMAQKADVRAVLELGKVGNGNQRDLMNLVTTNANLNLTRPLVEQLGGYSRYAMASSNTKLLNQLANPLLESNNSIGSLYGRIMLSEQGLAGKPTSRYSWNVSKTTGKLASAFATFGLDDLADSVKQIVTTTEGGGTAVSASASAAKNALDKMLDSDLIKESYVKKQKTYEDWVKDASKYGISDFEAAIEAAGYNEADIKAKFEAEESSAGAEENHRRDVIEEDFWNAGLNYWNEKFWSDYSTPMMEHMETVEQKLEDIKSKQDLWSSQFTTTWTAPWNLAWVDYRTAFDANWLDLGNRWKSFVTTTWSKEWLKETWKDSFIKNWDIMFGIKKDSKFNKLYDAVANYALNTSYYGTDNIKKSDLYKKITKIEEDTKKEDRQSIADQLGKVLSDTLIGDEQTDPALQTNILLGQILVYVGQIVQQNNTNSSGGTAFLDKLNALALGITTKS
jgi:hypothetical protein